MQEFEFVYYFRLCPGAAFERGGRRYHRLIHKAIGSVVHDFSTRCFHSDDCYQEALLALVNALRCFRDDQATKFSTYLYQCVYTSTIALVRRHKSKSYGLLDRALSLNRPLQTDQDVEMVDMIEESSGFLCPKQMASYYETWAWVKERLGLLKDQEVRIFMLRNAGYAYGDIARSMAISEKKVDNILYKLRRYFLPGQAS